MPNWVQINVQKINKSVYLLLQKYHRTHGLAVLGWSKSPGNHYYSFYSLAVHDENGHPLYVPEVWGRYSLTIYQDHIGLPAWGAGEQQTHPKQNQQELRSAELLAWYESHLDLRHFFKDYTEPIRQWRQTYHVSESEPYLLTWNIMGMFASISNTIIQTYGCSEYDFEMPDSKKEAVAALACQNPTESVHFCRGLAFSNVGKVRLPGGEQVDLWQKYLGGEQPAEMVNGLLEKINGGRKDGP